MLMDRERALDLAREQKIEPDLFSRIHSALGRRDVAMVGAGDRGLADVAFDAKLPPSMAELYSTNPMAKVVDEDATLPTNAKPSDLSSITPFWENQDSRWQEHALHNIPLKQPVRQLEHGKNGRPYSRAEREALAKTAYSRLRSGWDMPEEKLNDMGVDNAHRSEAALREMYPAYTKDPAAMLDLAERAWGVAQGSIPREFGKEADPGIRGVFKGEKPGGRPGSGRILLNPKHRDVANHSILHETHHGADYQNFGSRHSWGFNENQAAPDAFGQSTGHFENDFGNRGEAETLEAQNVFQRYGIPYPADSIKRMPQLASPDQYSKPLMPAFHGKPYRQTYPGPLANPNQGPIGQKYPAITDEYPVFGSEIKYK
jgi:hypothetical protein